MLETNTQTVHRDSPKPTKLRDYEVRGDAIIVTVERALYDATTMREAARGQVDLLNFQGPDQDTDPPSKWHLLSDAATAVIDAAAMAHSQEQRVRLANVALPYLHKLLDNIKSEESRRERDRGLFVTEQEIARPGGVDYLANVFSEALSRGQDIRFE